MGLEAGDRGDRADARYGLYPGARGRDLLLHVPAPTCRQRCACAGLRHDVLHDLRGGGPDRGLPRKIAPHAHEVSADGKFSWEEVECLGACANAPMAQIGKDYYEDLTAEGFAESSTPSPAARCRGRGRRTGAFPRSRSAGTSLTGGADEKANASVMLAERLGDTVARITGDEPSPRTAAAGRRAAADRPARGERARAGGGAGAAGGAGGAARGGAGRPEADQGRRAGAGGDAARARLLPLRPDRRLDAGGGRLGDENLEGFRGPVTREGWVEQARKLTEEGETPHAQAKDRGKNERGRGG